MRFKIDWASLIVGSKCTVLALFYFVFEGNFPSTSPRGAYIWRGDLTEGFCVTGLGGLYLEGLIFGILRYFNSTFLETPSPNFIQNASLKHFGSNDIVALLPSSKRDEF